MTKVSAPLFGQFKVSNCHNSGISSNRSKIHKITTIDDRKKMRNKGGCFCCRKRKIKCDELKPLCSNCEKSSYVCIWPLANESLPHQSDFKLTKIKKHKNIKFIVNDINPTVSTLPRQRLPKTSSTAEISNDPSNHLHITPRSPSPASNALLSSFDQVDGDYLEIPKLIQSNSEIQPVDTNIDDSDDSLEDRVGITPVLQSEDDSPIPLDDEVVSHVSEALSPVTEVSRQSFSSEFKETDEKELIEDALCREYLRELVPSSLVSLNGFNTWLPGITLSRDDAYLYNAFVNGFMVAISPQIAHINLQPGSVFVPAGINNPMLRDLFFACGASFLSQPSVKLDQHLPLIAYSKCDQAMSSIKDFIDVNPIEGNEEWMIIFLLLFCLKQKFLFEGSTSQTLNMISALQIVKLWLTAKFKRMNSDHGTTTDHPTKIEPLDAIDDDRLSNLINKDIDENELGGGDYSSDIPDSSGLESNKVFNQLIRKLKPKIYSSYTPVNFHSRNSKNPGFEPDTQDLLPLKNRQTKVDIHPYERTIIESFTYNYSNTLFICDRTLIPYLASPFELFETLRPFLTHPLYKCVVPWMNNPVVGASLPAVELQAKINWLSLDFPLSHPSLRLALSIKNTAKYYTHPILPTKIRTREPENVQRKLMESCYVADIITKGVYILASKLIDPSIQASDPDIQEAVEAAFRSFRKIGLHSQAPTIGMLAFAIVGCATIDPESIEYFKWRFKHFLEGLKIDSIKTVTQLCEVAWAKEVIDGTGLDVIIHPEHTKILII